LKEAESICAGTSPVIDIPFRPQVKEQCLFDITGSC